MHKYNFQAPEDLRLGAVSLRVRNLEAMLEFYSEFLGLNVLHLEKGRAELGFNPDQSLLTLTACVDGVSRPRQAAGLYHLALLVPDRKRLAQALKRLGQAGYPLQGAADHFVSEALYLADPEGNGIEIYADRARETWRWEDDQLRMGTAPLDIDDLLQLLEGEDANGVILAAGTVVGHIHLQVTNLQEAIQFYEFILGFDPMGLYGSSAAFYSAGGYHHHIGLNTWASADGPRARDNMLGLAEFEIVYRDPGQLRALTASLSRNGLAFDEVGQGITLEDPSGNLVKIHSDHARTLPS